MMASHTAVTNFLKTPLLKNRHRVRPQDLRHRVARGGHPPPASSERSVRISRTALFANRFTAQRVIAVACREETILVAAKENEP